jgi:hypothetical protein
MTSTAITFRQATTADFTALNELAQLDSSRLETGHYSVAEIDGRIVAAVSRASGKAIADPFRRTADVVEMLRSHAAPATVRQTRRHLSVRRARPAIA